MLVKISSPLFKKNARQKMLFVLYFHQSLKLYELMKKLFLSAILAMASLLVYAQNDAPYINRWFISARAEIHAASFDREKRIGDPCFQASLEVGRGFRTYHEGVLTLSAFADYGASYAWRYAVATGVRFQDMLITGRYGLFGPVIELGTYIVLNSDAKPLGATFLLSAGFTTEWRLHQNFYLTAGFKARFAGKFDVTMLTPELGFKVPF